MDGPFPIVAGLGNLHGRLAFNSSTLYIFKIFNHNPTILPICYTMNGLFLLVLVSWLILKINAEKFLLSKIVLFSLAFVFLLSCATMLASTSTDFIVNVIILYLLVSVVLNKNIFKQKMLLMAILPVVCLTMKLSAIAILILWIPLLYTVYKESKYKEFTIAVAIASCIGILWIIQNIMLSGYVFYPFPGIDLFSFDWKIPIESVQLEKEVTYAWARVPATNVDTVLQMSFGEWLPLWIRKRSAFNIIILFLSVISPIVFIVLAKKIKSNIEIFIAWSISILGLIFAFLTAPEFRFSFTFFLCSAFFPLFLLVAELKRGSLKKRSIALTTIWFMLIVWIFQVFLKDLFSFKLIDFWVHTTFYESKLQFVESEIDWLVSSLITQRIKLASLLLLAILIVGILRYKNTIYYFFNKKQKEILKFANYTALGLLFYFTLSAAILLEIFHDPDIPLSTLFWEPYSVKRLNTTTTIPFHEIDMGHGITLFQHIESYDMCENKAIPCTPRCDKNLELRGTTLEGGFRIKKDKE